MKYLRYISYVLLLACLVAPAFAGPTGRLRGTVKDPEGKPLEKVTITITATGDKPQTYTATTNAKGEYVHIGIEPMDYRITPSKEGYTAMEYAYIDLHVSPSDRPVEASFKMQSAQKKAEGKPEAGEAAAAGEGQKGVQLVQEGKYDEAIALFQKAIAAEPTNAGLHFNLGVAYERKNQMDEARKAFQAAVDARPDFGEAYLALGNSYMREQNFDKAVELFTKASELMPTSYGAAYNLGACLSNTGKYAEGEAAFRKAISLNANEPVTHYQLAMALLGQSKNAEAKAEFLKYLELNPNAADKGEVQDLLNSLQ